MLQLPTMLWKTFRKKSGTQLKAHALRKDEAWCEKLLWTHLRNRKLRDLKFRRQVPTGPYIVDFLCNEAKLIVEIDGNSHFEDGAAEYDARRTRFLQYHGFAVIRFTNNQVRENMEWVLEMIGDVATARLSPHPAPLPDGEGDFRRCD